MDRRLRWAVTTGLLLVLAALPSQRETAHAQTQIAMTKHNLTPSGPGTARTTVPSGLCVFCHTPHNASPTQGLWNISAPAQTYQVYQSSTTHALVGQPTGTSRMCLSCHDGTLAPGNLRLTPKGTPSTGFGLGLLTGSAKLGTDLSGSHPVSFLYDNALALARGELADPAALPSTVRLDETRQMQCTSCHDPHEDRQPLFLRVETRFGALCTNCHRLNHWPGSSHAASAATWNGGPPGPWPAVAFGSVGENGCMNCHRSHAAGHGERLLAEADEAKNCTVCHDATGASKNVQPEFSKAFRHDVAGAQWTHAPDENPLVMSRHVSCADCHNSHAVTSTPGTPPAVSGRLQAVKGVSLAGGVVAESSFEHEVCSKCHGVTEPTTTGLVRTSSTRNIRLKINPANASFHPIASAGRNLSMAGFVASTNYSPSTIITCTSCHTNDAAASGSLLAAAGPHGSIYEWILGAQYTTSDPAPESASSYALCYQCHDRNYLIGDQAGTFHHNRHVVVGQAPCAACHDGHGSQANSHLVDFMLRDRTGKVVVSPSSVQGLIQYTPLGAGHGQCYLNCHGVNHEPLAY